MQPEHILDVKMICLHPTQDERPCFQPYVFYFNKRHNHKTILSVSTAVKKTRVSLLLWNSVHLFELFPSLIPLWAYRKAQVRYIPGDGKSRHQKDKQHLFTLKNSLAELLPWWRYHTCRLNKAVRCLYHTVIPNLNRVLERIPIKFASLELSGHLWQG